MKINFIYTNDVYDLPSLIDCFGHVFYFINLVIKTIVPFTAGETDYTVDKLFTSICEGQFFFGNLFLK